MSIQQFCLRWNNHQPNFISVFTNLLNNESLVDVTLAAEGKHLQAHRVVLSACSTYFQTLFSVNPCQHPIVILKDVKYSNLKTIVDFMYYGEVNILQEDLTAVLKTAEMLKIKGLAEIPQQNIAEQMHVNKSLSVSSDKGEMLTSSESTWGPDSRCSPAPLSPSMRRKRLRKSSTGSGSGSAERTSEDLPSEITLVASPALVKPEHIPVTPDGESGRSEGSLRNSTQEPSTDSEPREGSQDSVEDEPLTLQISQDSSAGEVDPPIADTGPSTSQQSATPQAQVPPGKPGKRLLMRQHRIKKESDPAHTSPDSEPGSPHFASGSGLLSLPPVRIERQCSEPPLCTSPSLQQNPATPNLLTVPQPTFLVKQHSHPLLPSQQSSTCPASTTLLVQRQLSQPAPGQTCLVPPSSLHHVQVVAAPVQPPPNQEPTGRAVSPSVVIEQLPVLRLVSDQITAKIISHGGLRVRSDELRRASSSPQASSPREAFESQRSGHCPVLRPGPALGCNFCWNTIDGHGRILRRKTKYHCPECKTNLCIVPCFQEYHERQHAGGSRETAGSVSPTIMKILPKTSSI
ncbi:protein tramtrack, alpha isoform isoform X1 [Zootermopsis nevadensis]|uniref:protein tramtrack, alpha isoform isoform X1 n=1 Tax=Zootermopsis nevadensis TaxID=136037 RepID=UPI000B8ED9F2|nr:protein tramtrack, alpha isoform isoform X1 [Zootermopsis nevadensis]XP_021915344.1 protein tramtrack, alpha isoform isoform X1 [Zootermopsis nevadensis]